jgi:hypothetical protein
LLSSLIFAVNALRALFLSVLHTKKKIYIFAFVSLTAFLFIDVAHLIDANTPKHCIRKKKKRIHLIRIFFSFFPIFLILSKQQKEKEENMMTIMKIYFVRFYITRDREKEKENTATENI